MTDPIYCYYHPYMRLEITRRHGETYAVCPECRQIMTDILCHDIRRSACGECIESDDLIRRMVNRSAPVSNPVPPIYMYIDEP